MGDINLQDSVVLIPGHPFYGVTEDGTVWTRHIKGPLLYRDPVGQWRKLSQSNYGRGGYVRVCLQVGGKSKGFTVHYLMAITFIGPVPEGYEVNHKDGNKKNNAVDNLEVITQGENLEHAWAHGLIVIGKPKLTLDQVMEIRRLKAEGVKQPALAKQFGVGQSAISDIVNYRTWKKDWRVLPFAA